MVLDLRLSKDWDVEMTSFLFLPSSPLSFGTREALLERPPANGTREAQLEQPPALERPLGLERAKRYWNALRASGTALKNLFFAFSS